MYTTERNYDMDFYTMEAWAILDPDGDPITHVFSKNEADALLTHLNR